MNEINKLIKLIRPSKELYDSRLGDSSITNKEYVKLNKISRETAKRDLSDLLEKRFLKLMGKGRSVFYVIGP